MAWQKIWLGSVDTNFANVANWQAISLRNAAFTWTQKGATAEYYVRAAGPADPAFGAKPGQVLINGAVATEGTLGSLAVGQWCWGDPDSLGYNTITVRVTADADPGSLARDYVQFRAVPNGADSVTLSSLAARGIASGLDQSGLSAAAWVIEPGFREKPIGAQGQPLRIKPSSLVIDGGGSQPWYIDIGTETIAVEVRGAPASVNGLHGLYLTGTGITTLTVRAGNVGLAAQPGEVSTAALVLALGGQVTLGPGVTLTTARCVSGNIVLQCGGATFDCQGGQMTTQLAAVAGTAVLISGGTFLDRSSGTHAAVTLHDGTLDTTKLQGAKTFTTFVHHAGTFHENIELLTIGTRQEPAYSGTVTRARAS